MIPVNLGDQIQVKTLKVSAVETATATGSAVDLQGWEGEIAVVLNAAHGSGNADNTLDLKIQNSDDGSTNWTDVVGASFTQVGGTTDSTQSLSVNKNEIKRYIRYSSTVAGTSKSFVYSLVAVGMNKYQA